MVAVAKARKGARIGEELREQVRKRYAGVAVDVRGRVATRGPANARLRLHWSLPDPSGATGADEDRLEVFRSVRDELRARIEREIIPVRR